MCKPFIRGGYLIVLLLLSACGSVPSVSVLSVPELMTKKSQQQEIADPASQTQQGGEAFQVPTVSAKASVFHEQAMVALQNGQLAEAKSAFLNLAEQYPELASPHINLGLIYVDEGDAEQAGQHFEQAVALQPAACDAHVQLGVLARQAYRFDDAKTHYLTCLEVNPDFAPALLNLGILHELYLGEPELAVGYYEAYQKTQLSENREVAAWISQLVRQLNNQVAAGYQP